MKITPEQRAKIDTLYCERLSSNDANLRLVDDFINIRNTSISNTLLNEAYEEDESGKVAYYVVKNQDNKILFYFSLKCGMLYDSLYFREAVDVATAKPIYDLTCKFMYQETEKLLSEQEYFFEHYNIDNDEA